MAPSTTTHDHRRRIASKYGYPWPWQVRELVEEYAVERDVDIRQLAKEWGCTEKCLRRAIRQHGFRTENYQATR